MSKISIGNNKNVGTGNYVASIRFLKTKHLFTFITTANP